MKIKDKEILENRILHLVYCLVVYGFFYYWLQYTFINEIFSLGGLPNLMGIMAIIILIIAFILNQKFISISCVIGYVLGIAISIMMETRGIVADNQSIHTLHNVWFNCFWLIMGLGTIINYGNVMRKNNSFKYNSNKKNYDCLFFGCLIVFVSFITYATRPLTMKDVIQHKPRFAGVVVEVYGKESVLVKVNKNDAIYKSSHNEAVYKSSHLIKVSLDVIKKDAISYYNVGDEITVYYDGNILETYPAQVNKVYATLN